MNTISESSNNGFRKKFLITIDTEGDNLWSKPKHITVDNALFLQRFQSLCEKYGFKPTYLVNYEMANCKCFQSFANNILKNNAAEIGMHLHAWNSPPLIQLTEDDSQHQPYLIEYDSNAIKEKIKVVTYLLEDIFQTKMVSHRAGRWVFNEEYAKALAEYGYLIDCSVTPNVNWSNCLGNPKGQGGTNYIGFNSKPYFMDLDNIKIEGTSQLLEVPMTVVQSYKIIKRLYNLHESKRRFIDGFAEQLYWLRPRGNNLNNMLHLVNYSISIDDDYIQFMLHSSELMPGGSPIFKDEYSIEKLYEDLEILFDEIKKNFVGMTLKEFYENIKNS